MKILPRVNAIQAQAVASLLLSDHLPDRFTADQATLDETADVWRVSVILAYPNVGILGKVGEIWVSTTSDRVLSYTPIEDMKQTGIRLYQAHQDEIQSAFS